MRKIIYFLMFVFFILSVTAKPVLNTWVVDEANVLAPATEEQLTSLFQQLNNEGVAQIAVVTVKTLEGETIEQYALDLAHNNLGDKEKDNGLLLLIALEERAYRIEVGQGLEGILNDAKAGRIAREHLVPYLKENNYDQGVLETATTLANIIRGNETLTEEPNVSINPNIKFWIFVGFFLLFMIISIIANRGKKGGGFIWIGGPGFGGRSSGGFGGGGFSGGGGGFGGGGAGGRF
ncbi:MAG: TPM domain-containing protein [Nanoarchaeota archaeon]|nr:TPM domain-containing protein [Nanoarchaeota archaeon]